MNICVYSGVEVIDAHANIISALRSAYAPNYSIQTVSAQDLAYHPWSSNCALFVLPPCSRPFNSPASARSLEAFVEQGGAFLAFSVGWNFIPREQLVPKQLPLKFFDRFSGSYTCPIQNAADTTVVTALRFSDGDTLPGLSYNPQIETTGVIPPDAILARHEATNAIAGLKKSINKGIVILWSVSVDISLESHAAIIEKLVRKTVDHLCLQIPSPDLKSNISWPLPQFLTATQPEIISRFATTLGASSSKDPAAVIEDANDTFHLHSFSTTSDLLAQAKAAPTDSSNSSPKHIIICDEGQLPDPLQTSLFNLQLYQRELASARQKHAYDTYSNSWGIGEVLLYGEVVTSTQTMLDKNPRFLSLLPTPLVSLASYQLAGRGRGSNVWLSPSGCLQFSILLRMPLSKVPASKIVFVQYLFALAVTEACREESIIGEVAGGKVQLKWPNDLYAVHSDGVKTKIGGILVNTSFTGGTVDIVIGCGLNVLNPPPITSLSQLAPAVPLTMERAAAVIMANFETMWNTFVDGRGSFDPFMNLYLERWLHSDQLVTLSTTVPPTSVRIVGITPDHGLLRTLPERTGYNSRDAGFIDLQPDGNSFDLMSGLIKTKGT